MHLKFIRWSALLWFICLTVASKQLAGQERSNCGMITTGMGFTVRSVIVKGRWISDAVQREVERMAGIGEVFSSDNLSNAMTLVRSELIKGEERYVVQLVGATSVLLVTADVCDVSDSLHPKQAEIVIRPFYLRIDLYNTGDNILPVPRTARPTFYEHVPAALLATAPRLSLTNDRRFGAAAALQTSTDLLHLPNSMKSNRDSKRFNLLLGLNVRKSIDNAFYTMGAGLVFEHPVYHDTSIGWRLAVNYTGSRDPLGDGDNKTGTMKISGAIQGNLPSLILNKYAVGASAVFSNNEVNMAFLRVKVKENSYVFNVIADGKIGTGFSRIGLWFGAGVPKINGTNTNYQRLAGRINYGIVLGRTHNNFDLETSVGLGINWGAVPVYNQFYSGNSFSNFLNMDLKSEQMQAFPAGPLLRSLGEKEGSFTTAPGLNNGGNRYWNLNLSLSFPVSGWARPLIPDIVIDEETGSTARRKIKGLVGFAKSFIQLDLTDNRGLTDEAAEKKADRIVNKDIRPAINYLADRANVYSIKPVLLFDLAQLAKRGYVDKMWIAGGAGIQLNIVTAKFDFGYMQTLAPSADRSKGNFVVRFTVQNFY